MTNDAHCTTQTALIHKEANLLYSDVSTDYTIGIQNVLSEKQWCTAHIPSLNW